MLLFIGIFASLTYFFSEYRFALRMSIGLYYLLATVYMVGLVAGRHEVKHLLLVHDLLWGHIMFIPLFVLAILQIPDRIQTWLLYHNALSEGVVIDRILEKARYAQARDLDDAPLPTTAPMVKKDELKRAIQEVLREEGIDGLRTNFGVQLGSPGGIEMEEMKSNNRAATSDFVFTSPASPTDVRR